MSDFVKYINGFQHLGIYVSDLDRSISFYVNELGFRLTDNCIVMDSQAGALKVAFVEKGDCVIELFRALSDRGGTPRRGMGVIDHFALNINSLEEDVTGPDGELIVACKRPVNHSGAKTSGWSYLSVKSGDLEVSKNFYRQFGFEVVREDVINISGFEEFEVAFMELCGFVIELVKTPQGLKNFDRLPDTVDHFALDVSNIQDLFLSIRKAGLSPLSCMVKELNVGVLGIKYFMIQGPFGELIEFNSSGATHSV